MALLPKSSGVHEKFNDIALFNIYYVNVFVYEQSRGMIAGLIAGIDIDRHNIIVMPVQSHCFHLSPRHSNGHL